MQNHNEIKCKKVGDAFKHSYGCVTKVNLYSLLEDMVVKILKTTYLLEVSLRLTQGLLRECPLAEGKGLPSRDKSATSSENWMVL
jgi:hypothetical protein